PFSAFRVKTSLLGGDEQRRIAQVFIGGFLEATLNGRREYEPMFRDPRRAAAWVPKTIYIWQFEDSSLRVVTDFESGIDLTRGTLAGTTLSGENLTVWREGDFRGRTGWPFRVKTVYLGWSRAATPGVPSYRIALPPSTAAEWKLEPRSRLVLVIADTNESPT